jgi:hypothetical protein
MTRPDYQMISHMALLRMLHRKGEFRVGSMLSKKGLREAANRDSGD